MEKDEFCKEDVDCGEAVNRHEGSDIDAVEPEDDCEEGGCETGEFISLLIDESKSFIFACIFIVCDCLFNSLINSAVGTGG